MGPPRPPTWIARPWRTGSAALLPSSGCAQTAARASQTRAQALPGWPDGPSRHWRDVSRRTVRRCSIRGTSGPRPAICGRSPVTTGRGVAPIRRRSPSLRARRGRRARHPAAGWLRRTLQVDGGAYPRPGYGRTLADSGRAGNPVMLAHCWSHVWRGFYEIAQEGNGPIAEAALQRIERAFRRSRSTARTPSSPAPIKVRALWHHRLANQNLQPRRG